MLQACPPMPRRHICCMRDKTLEGSHDASEQHYTRPLDLFSDVRSQLV